MHVMSINYARAFYEKNSFKSFYVYFAMALNFYS